MIKVEQNQFLEQICIWRLKIYVKFQITKIFFLTLKRLRKVVELFVKVVNFEFSILNFC